MSADRHYSPIDHFLLQVDSALCTLLPFGGQPARPSPAIMEPDGELNEEDTHHIADPMRINHTGKACAQVLYQGQSLTAKLPEVREAMEKAAGEEIDHLAWYEQRIHQLGSRPNVLNPIFYGLSFSIGTIAGLVGNRVSLNFVATTEDQVCRRLGEHPTRIPQEGRKFRVILEQIRINEEQHSSSALATDGLRFPAPMKLGISLLARVMTEGTCHI